MHVLGQQLMTSKCLCGGNERTVPIRQSMTLANLQSRHHDRDRNLLDRKAAPRLYQGERRLVRDSIRARYPRGLPVEFLKDLGGEGQIPLAEHLQRSLTLSPLCRCATD